MKMTKFCDMCGEPLQSTHIAVKNCKVCHECEQSLLLELHKAKAVGNRLNALQIARDHYKQHYSGGNYMLRDISKVLKGRVADLALENKCKIRDVILAALWTCYVRK